MVCPWKWSLKISFLLWKNPFQRGRGFKSPTCQVDFGTLMTLYESITFRSSSICPKLSPKAKKSKILKINSSWGFPTVLRLGGNTNIFPLYLSKVLPRDKPRYLMGVGFALDLVVCSALGVDMYDCVFPSRTARFGSALIMKHPGSLNMKQKVYRTDFSPIEEDCPCATCTRCLID